MKKFSNTWKSSKKQRKQRKYRFKSPLHVKQKLMHAHLSRELKKKYGKRSVGLRKGDKVRIMRGQYRKHENKIERIDLKKTGVFVSGIEITKKDGSKNMIMLDPSNIMIIELNLDDKLRQKSIERK